MDTQAMEQIKRDIEIGTSDAREMGLDCPIVKAQRGGVDIMTRFSRDTSRRSNGGDYDYWTEYRIRSGRLLVKEAASCDFWQPEQEWRDFGPMTYNELSKAVELETRGPGRPRFDPAAPTVRTTIRLTQAQLVKATEIGAGNVGAGVRAAIEAA